MAPGRRRDAEQQFPRTVKRERLCRAAGWDLNFGLQRIPLKNGQKKKKKLQILKQTQPEDKLTSEWEIRIQVQISTETSS